MTNALLTVGAVVAALWVGLLIGGHNQRAAVAHHHSRKQVRGDLRRVREAQARAAQRRVLP